MAPAFTVAIPVLDGARTLATTLAAVAAQRVDGEVELIVADSGSRDGSALIARAFGAKVIDVAPGQFGHGRTRNLLMQRSHGDAVAFLTQDSEPADDRWLSRLAGGLALSDDVALAFGPYRPRPEASPMVARELTQWFAAFSPHGNAVIDRLSPGEPASPASALLGRPGFFTDANGCLRRSAWERVPFRDVAYGEDHMLALDMLRAGLAKAFVPAAAVVHSHNYGLVELLRRNFDEARALEEVYGWQAPLSPVLMARNVWGNVGADRRWWLADAQRPHGPTAQLRLLTESTLHHAARTAGGALGGRAPTLPSAAARRLSLERRPNLRER